MGSITKEHVEKAIKKFLSEDCNYSDKNEYYLSYNGKLLPSKNIVGLALSFKDNPNSNQVKYDPYTLNGGDTSGSAASVLKALGYNIVQIKKYKAQRDFKTGLNSTDWEEIIKNYIDKFHKDNKGKNTLVFLVYHFLEGDFIGSTDLKNKYQIPVDNVKTCYDISNILKSSSKKFVAYEEPYTTAYLKGVNEFKLRDEVSEALKKIDMSEFLIGHRAPVKITGIVPKIDNYAEDDNEKIDEQVKGGISLDRSSLSNMQETEKKGERVVPKRNPQIAAYALQKAQFKCEVNDKHQTFIKASTDKPYMEPHHLIPISKYEEFNGVNLDIPENIVSLCSHCHNLLHYGKFEDKEHLLNKLYAQQKDALIKCGIKISLADLEKIYGKSK